MSVIKEILAEIQEYKKHHALHPNHIYLSKKKYEAVTKELAEDYPYFIEETERMLFGIPVRLFDEDTIIIN